MNAITLGKPIQFLKGMVNQIYREPSTGNIVGFDKVASDTAINIEYDQGLIEGGFNNPIVGMIPASVRATGTYTSQAFSLETRQLITGGSLGYNGVSSVCEQITASGTTLTVTGNPVKHYGQPSSDTLGWCYVREHGASEYQGTNYGIDLTTKTIDAFTAVNGTTYDVIYFVNNASAQVLQINDQINPTSLCIEQVYGLYAQQGVNNSYGTLKANVHVIVPLAKLTGNPGITGSQTKNSTTDGSWMALSDVTKGDVLCDSCANLGNPYIYYVIVPCDGNTSEVEALAVPGGEIDLKTSQSKLVPVVYIMPNGQTVTPDYSDLTFTSSDTDVVTVGQNTGVATGGASTGSAEITISANGGALLAYCNVLVTS